METLHSDAFVFFGATGDLAYKQIFPALQALMPAETFAAVRPAEADRIIPGDGGWHNPKHEEAIG